MTGLYEALQARLETEGVPNYLIDVPARPGGSYIVIYPATGLASPHGYTGSPSRQTDVWRIMAVSTSPLGIVDLVEHIRERVGGWNPNPADPAQDPAYEIDDGPVLTDRVESQTLHSLTLVYRAHRRRKQPTHVEEP